MGTALLCPVAIDPGSPNAFRSSERDEGIEPPFTVEQEKGELSWKLDTFFFAFPSLWGLRSCLRYLR
jgi:hypothetical protein